MSDDERDIDIESDVSETFLLPPLVRVMVVLTIIDFLSGG